MALTPSSVKRSTDATGDDILTLTTPGGDHVQAVALVDDAGSPMLDYGVNDVAEVGTVTYVGKEAAGGTWIVQKIDATTGLVIRYATVGNNAAVADYAAAWAGRLALTYGTWAEAG